MVGLVDPCTGDSDCIIFPSQPHGWKQSVVPGCDFGAAFIDLSSDNVTDLNRDSFRVGSLEVPVNPSRHFALPTVQPTYVDLSASDNDSSGLSPKGVDSGTPFEWLADEFRGIPNCVLQELSGAHTFIEKEHCPSNHETQTADRSKKDQPTKTEAAPTTKTEAAPKTKTEAAPTTKTEVAPTTKTESVPITRGPRGPYRRANGGPRGKYVRRGRPTAAPITLLDDWDTEEFPYEGPERERELLKKLRDMKQTPPPGPFCKEDVAWIPIRTQSAGQYFLHEVAVIPWSRLDDFRNGEGMDKMFPCRFTKETLKKRPPGSLKTPRANSASKVIK